MPETIPLFRKYPGLSNLPRIELVDRPTPLQKLEKLSRKLNSELWVKRDDLCSKIYGGNKPRKLEFILADAKRKNKQHVLTAGGIGSNHALATTIFAKDLGMDIHLYLFYQPLSEHVRRNLLCDHYHGAHIHYSRNEIWSTFKLLVRGKLARQSYMVWIGASSPLGTVGFVNAALEMAEQVEKGVMPEPDKIFVAIGSKGTAAGLALGLELAGLKTKVIGISVSMKWFTSHLLTVRLARKTLKLLRKYDKSIPDVGKKLNARLDIIHEFYGGEYGRATQEGLEAIDLMNEEGIHLDTTYSGKAFSGLVAYCRENGKASNETLLFWNTLNSVDLSSQYSTVDYVSLPESLHVFFDGAVPLDTSSVQAREKL